MVDRYTVTRMVHDAAEKAAKEEFRRANSDAARAERLRTRLGPFIGVIPDEHVTSHEVGKYGLEKLRQDLPDNADYASALEYFLAGHASRQPGALDSAPEREPFYMRQLRGE